jgi:hypothetical protein
MGVVEDAVTAARCWHALIVTGAGTQEVAEFIMLWVKAHLRVLSTLLSWHFGPGPALQSGNKDEIDGNQRKDAR